MSERAKAAPREESEKAALKRRRLIYLVVSACALLVLGLVYAWSIFAVPLGEAFNWDRSLLSYTFSISMTAFCFGALIGSFIVRKWSIRVSIFAAAVLQAGGFILTAVMAPQGIWALYLFYGVFAGLGCGFGYNTIISTVNLWFPDRIGLASGVLMMGFGLGSLILGTLANAAMEAFGWNATFIIIGLVSACVLVLLGLLLKPAPENIDVLFGKTQAKKSIQVSVEEGPMLKTPIFYLYFLWAVLLFGALMTLMGDSKQGALALGVDASLATLIVGLVSMMNGLARVVVGMVFDKTNLRIAMSLVSVVGVAAIGCIAASFVYGLPWLYLASALLVGFAAGGVPVMSSSFARERFPAKDFSRNLATVNFSIAGSALISSIVVSIGRPLGGDIAVYVILFGVVLIALVDALVFFRLYYKKKDASV